MRSVVAHRAGRRFRGGSGGALPLGEVVPLLLEVLLDKGDLPGDRRPPLPQGLEPLFPQR